jgi:hypothetical protein
MHMVTDTSRSADGPRSRDGDIRDIVPKLYTCPELLAFPGVPPQTGVAPPLNREDERVHWKALEHWLQWYGNVPPRRPV